EARRIAEWAEKYELQVEGTVLSEGKQLAATCILVWASAFLLKAFSEQVDKVALRKAAMAAQSELAKFNKGLGDIVPSVLSKKASDALVFK
ncbi:unnamed protein product, partial [Prorocentrum cordatum]